MKKETEHLVPQVVIDTVNNALWYSKNNKLHVDTYIARIEAMRDYCEKALKKIEKEMK